MSDSGEDNKDKSEEPTENRLRKAREEQGRIPMSKEIPILASFVIFMFYLLFVMPVSLQSIALSLQDFFGLVHDIPRSSGAMMAYVVNKLIDISIHIIPLLLGVFFAIVIAYISQNGLVISFAVFENIGLQALNPISGVKKIFSIRQLIEIGKGLIKVLGFILITLGLFWGLVENFSNMPIYDFSKQQDTLLFYVILIMISAILTMIPVAIIDYIYENWEYRRNLRMTPDEVKKDHKETDGDAEIKGKIRQIRTERMKEMLAQAVQKSDVVVTNPTHYAVALQYDDTIHPAPIVAAKAVDELALHLREIAKKYDIPIQEDPPLARTLYATVEVGEIIKEEQYEAVAKIIRYVLNLKKRKSAFSE